MLLYRRGLWCLSLILWKPLMKSTSVNGKVDRPVALAVCLYDKLKRKGALSLL